MTGGQERVKFPDIEFAFSIEFAAKQTSALFLSPEETLEKTPVTLQITEKKFLQFERILYFCDSMTTNKPLSLSPKTWDGFVDNQKFTLCELERIQNKPPFETQTTENSSNFSQKEMELKISAASAKGIVASLLACLAYTRLLSLSYDQSARKEKLARYVLIIKSYLEDSTDLLTQLRRQGIEINAERLNFLQERVNRLNTLLSPT